MGRLIGCVLFAILLTLGAIPAPIQTGAQTIPPVVYLPIIRKQPAPTMTPTPRPTSTLTPTPTLTPTMMPTPTLKPVASPTAAHGYICTYNAYNCSDFEWRSEAQTVFDYCMDLGWGDIHRLDTDDDMIACEALP